MQIKVENLHSKTASYKVHMHFAKKIREADKEALDGECIYSEDMQVLSLPL